MRIRAGDTVVVISGADRGVRSKVISIDRQAGKALVEGVNKVFKHVRRSQKHPQGGRLSREMPVQISNLLLFCEPCGKGVRVGARVASDGGKERFCKKCGRSLGQISPPSARRAKVGA